MAQILRPKAVFATSGKSRTATYADQAKGLFPRFFKLGSRAAGMTDEECDLMNAARASGASEAELKKLVNRIHAARKSSKPQIS